MTTPAAPTVAAGLVLAAGSATRFGATKQVAEVDGRPMVAHAVAVAHAAGLRPVYVVVGHDRGVVAAAARQAGEVEVVDNPDHAAGQAGSLRRGIEAVAAGPDVDVVVVLLADQPGLRPAVVSAVADAAAAAPDGIARARYRDGDGHPVGLGHQVWPRLLDLSGDEGARQLFEGYDVATVSVAEDTPRDVDTPGDLARARSHQPGGRRPSAQ
ncbi:NTP transferase domain-containing protein [Egicoccus sp. AB-alg6-2]|uniref:nucleotidyltransferase family protein n=1 Tax=Egicoccus sp. AB-alg6-2 TaxID=3242692 RepID=UPI00359D056E